MTNSRLASAANAANPANPAEATPLNRLDQALAAFVQQAQPSDDPRHAWLAALVSHQYGRGHACLDLAALQREPGPTLGWEEPALQALPPTACPGCTAPAAPWCARASACTCAATGRPSRRSATASRRAWPCRPRPLKAWPRPWPSCFRPTRRCPGPIGRRWPVPWLRAIA